MTKSLYVIRDTLAGQVVGSIIMFPHHAAAIRFFSDVAQDKQTLINKHLADHELICIGRIDDESGQITALGPEPVITGAALKAAQAPAGEV